jgi:hypothetical protein
MGSDVGAPLSDPVQYFAVPERECGLQSGAVVEFGQVQDGVYELGAGTWDDVSRYGAQRRPGGPDSFL